ncbi:MAG: acid protease [Flavobacteriaceae bacterium]|nr:acid protease [Flavobacteriaceae bacterium]
MHLRNFLEDKDFTRITLKTLNTGHYKVSVKINEVQGNFILDTGASTSCVGFHCSKKFQLSSEESDIRAAGAGAVNMATRLSLKNSLRINSWKTSNMDLVLFDLSHVNEALSQGEEEAVDGIIGADFLKKFRAVIDYGRNALYIK